VKCQLAKQNSATKMVEDRKGGNARPQDGCMRPYTGVIQAKTGSGKQNAEKALRLLNNESSHEIIYEFADTSLLPEDFDKRSPDNMIISVALKYKSENPIMLTSDNGLQLKSKILGISTVSLRNFLKR
jgi:predicted ribonuclease YlaK